MTDRYDIPAPRREGDPTIVDFLRWRAEHEPGRRSHTYLEDGERREVHADFAALDRRARAIAARLRDQGLAGERVLLIYPTGLEYVAAFYGCLYAGAIAVPAYPPDPSRLEHSLPRLLAIVRDCAPAAALTTTGLLAAFAGALVQTKLARPLSKLPLPDALGGRALRGLAALDTAPLERLRWLSSERIADAAADAWRGPDPGADDVAYLQYTSGSTAAPRGVVVRHRNLIANLALGTGLIGVTAGSVSVGWLPLYHDMGLVCYVTGSAYNGCTTVLQSPLEFLARPLAWLRAIDRHGATHAAAPNFAYDLCVRRTTPEQRAALDLRRWRRAGNGAEPVRLDTLRRFCDAFAASGFAPSAFLPAYGLAEATLFVSAAKPEDRPPEALPLHAASLAAGRVVPVSPGEEARVVVACGRTGPGHRVIAVDPETREPCPPDRVGELWFAGPSVASGYWRQEAVSRDTFEARTADGDGPFLRTGDLGFVRAGQVHVTGRRKDMVVLHGENYYPQDIEQSVWDCDRRLRPGCGAAFAVDGEGGEALVIVQEVEAPAAELPALAEAARRAVARDHGLAVAALVLIPPRTIAKTSSGKIQRGACRELYRLGKLRVLHQGGEP
jgi:acyl-CoA synthetase (AMP-forming)/AMP-acid ligase II